MLCQCDLLLCGCLVQYVFGIVVVVVEVFCVVFVVYDVVVVVYVVGNDFQFIFMCIYCVFVGDQQGFVVVGFVLYVVVVIVYC